MKSSMPDPLSVKVMTVAAGLDVGLVVTVIWDAPARRAFWSSSMRIWLVRFVKSLPALLRILALTCA